jgi:hypothetical protein
MNTSLFHPISVRKKTVFRRLALDLFGLAHLGTNSANGGVQAGADDNSSGLKNEVSN